MDMIDVSPDVHFVNSMRSRNLGWEKALAELIDNALDAKATQIKIATQGRQVCVSDDGRGVRDLAATVTSGKHVPGEFTELASDDEPDDYDYPIVKAFEQCDYRLNTLKRICEMLAPHERQVMLDFLLSMEEER